MATSAGQSGHLLSWNLSFILATLVIVLHNSFAMACSEEEFRYEYIPTDAEILTNGTHQIWNGVKQISTMVKIELGASVTVEAGTILNFDPNGEISVSGNFTVTGTESNPVYFNGPGKEGKQLRGNSKEVDDLIYCLIYPAGHRAIKVFPTQLFAKDRVYVNVEYAIFSNFYVAYSQPDQYDEHFGFNLHRNVENRYVVFSNSVFENNAFAIFDYNYDYETYLFYLYRDPSEQYDTFYRCKFVNNGFAVGRSRIRRYEECEFDSNGCGVCGMYGRTQIIRSVFINHHSSYGDFMQPLLPWVVAALDSSFNVPDGTAVRTVDYLPDPEDYSLESNFFHNNSVALEGVTGHLNNNVVCGNQIGIVSKQPSIRVFSDRRVRWVYGENNSIFQNAKWDLKYDAPVDDVIYDYWWMYNPPSFDETHLIFDLEQFGASGIGVINKTIVHAPYEPSILPTQLSECFTKTTPTQNNNEVGEQLGELEVIGIVSGVLVVVSMLLFVLVYKYKHQRDRNAKAGTKLVEASIVVSPNAKGEELPIAIPESVPIKHRKKPKKARHESSGIDSGNREMLSQVPLQSEQHVSVRSERFQDIAQARVPSAGASRLRGASTESNPDRWVAGVRMSL